jgi:organic radical activating enzyme
MGKLASAFKKSINERAALKKKNMALMRKNASLLKQFEELKKMFLEQLSTHKEQNKMIEELKQHLDQPNKPAMGKDISIEESDNDEDDKELFSVRYV